MWASLDKEAVLNRYLNLLKVFIVIFLVVLIIGSIKS